MVVLSIRTGDLFRLFEGGRGSRVRSESDLRDLDELQRMEPRYAHPIPPEQGDEFALVDFRPCADCGGTGLERTDAWYGVDRGDPDDGPQACFIKCAEHAGSPTWRETRGFRWNDVYLREDDEHDCCWCQGTGRAYEFSDATLRRGELAMLPGAA